MKIIKIAAVVAFAASFTACDKDYLNTAPTAQVDADAAFLTTTNAWAALNGIHRAMYVQYRSSQDQGGEGSMNIYRDMLGEDLVMTAVGNGWYNNTYKWLDHRNENSGLVVYAYQFPYRLIGNANLIIANIDNAEGPQADRDAIKGQALVYRAWAHFQMVQLYGKRYVAGQNNAQPGVPLMLTPTTEGQARATVEEIYTQINKDLDDAIALLKANRPAKSHFNVNVAKGIKARVALTQQNWTVAAQQAAEARQGFNLMTNAEYLQGFNNISNQEWMWGSRQVDDQTTFFYSFFAYMSCNFNSTNIRTNPKAINRLIYDQMSATDIRRKCWIPNVNEAGITIITPPGGVKRNYMTQKFQSSSSSNSVGDVPLMRAAEMYLIEAEAKARSGDDEGARQALFTLMKNRDPEYQLSTNTGQALIDEIMLNRRIELWGEGFRFTDLKRLNLPLNRNGANHTTALALTFDVAAGVNDWEFLLPRAELNANPLVVQNPQ
jgi:starch-binding outer membrane protein, SusD/RagB family